jgi:hypothetical protein
MKWVKRYARQNITSAIIAVAPNANKKTSRTSLGVAGTRGTLVSMTLILTMMPSFPDLDKSFIDSSKEIAITIRKLDKYSIEA